VQAAWRAVRCAGECYGSATMIWYAAAHAPVKCPDSGQLVPRGTTEKPTSTTRATASRPSMRSTKQPRARRPIAVPSTRTVDSAGWKSRASAEIAEADTARRSGTAMPRARASITTPSASRSELQKMASMARMACEEVDQAGAPLPAVVGARTMPVGHAVDVVRRESARTCRRDEALLAPQRACVVAGEHRQVLSSARDRCSATAAPMRSWRSDDRADRRIVRSQVSTTGMPEACSRRRPASECTMPVSTMPSGRRPMIASRRSSRAIRHSRSVPASAGSPRRRVHR